jgi:prepilin-type processing-associated H-X9-DG protein
MRNVALALNSYELNHRQYPGYSNVQRLNNGQVYSDPATGQPRGVSYIIPLLSYLDEPALEQRWKDPAAFRSRGPGSNLAMEYPTKLTCASDRPNGKEPCPLSYVVNCGMPDFAGTAGSPTKPGIPRDWAANGVFFDLFTGNPELTGGKPPQPTGKSNDDFGVYDTTQSGIPLVGMSCDYINRHDGIGQTCLLSENVDAGQYTDDSEAAIGIVWNGSGSIDVGQSPPHLKPPVASMAISVGVGEGGPQPAAAFARPSSYHQGGVNMTFCDGKVRFVSDSMDYYVYCLLMSSNGKQVKLPGSTKVLPNFDRVPDETWYIK